MKKKLCKVCGKEVDIELDLCECGSTEFKAIAKKDPNSHDEITRQLKEILPELISKRQILDKAADDHQKVKDLSEQLKRLEGTIEKLNSNVIELGKKKVRVQSTGWDNEMKFDFAKYFVNLYKLNSNEHGEKDSYRAAVKDVIDKYSVNKTTLVEGTDSLGGYFIPEPFRDAIWRVAADTSFILSRGTQVPMGRANKLPRLNLASGVSVSWVSEGGSINESNPTFSKTTTDVEKLAAHTIITNELLEDEEVGVVDLLITLFGEAMGEEIDSQAMNGSGSPFTGVLNASGVNTVTMTGSTFASLDSDDLSDMIAQIRRSVRMNMMFVMHRTIKNLIRKLKDDNGQPIYFGPAGSEPGSIFGYPYEENEQMPSISDTAASTPFIWLGNPRYIQVGIKGPMTVESTRSLKILTDESVFVFRRRLCIDVGLANAFSILKTGSGS